MSILDSCGTAITPILSKVLQTPDISNVSFTESEAGGSPEPPLVHTSPIQTKNQKT